MTSSLVYEVAYWFLFFSLIVGVASTFVLIKSGKAKEEQLQRELADTKLEASLANERAEKIKKELLGRRLSEEQIKALISELRPFPPAKLIITNPPDIESATFANDFVKTLTNAGWMVEYRPQAIWSYELEYGLSVSRTDNGNSERLIKALGSVGIRAELDAPEAVLTLFIKSKPIPIIE